jgi:hypothetical protein
VFWLLMSYHKASVGTLTPISSIKVSRHLQVVSSWFCFHDMCAVDRGFEPRRFKPKTIKLVFVASLLSTQH